MAPFDPATRAAVEALLAEYAAALDERRYDDWLALFDDEAAYVLQPRENHDRGLPLATMRLESRGMLQDRLYGIQNTLFHQPYYQRHVVGHCRPSDHLVRVPGRLEEPAVPADAVLAQASYAVFRTKDGEPTTVFNVGRYLLCLVPVGPALRIRNLTAVFDSALIPTSVIYPI
jgi:salicylate 5-hydroxylase small subunit